MLDGQFRDVQAIIKRHPRVFALVGLSVFVSLLTMAGCSHGTVHGTAKAGVAAEFVSENECVSCHADISKSCAASNHAHTLRIASLSALGVLAPPRQAIPQTFYTVRGSGDRLGFDSTIGNGAEKPIDLALGSGKLGMTYVTLEKDNTLTELRMSWYPSRNAWYLTPGQENDADNNLGEHNDPERSRSCMGCHAVTVPLNGVRPEDRFFGVGCQSCHGPASLHIAAARSGKMQELHMERMRTWNATRINDMCGRCHRSAGNVSTSGDEVTMTQRFQPYGLMQSPCFQKSGDTLSCITCHSPHANTVRDSHVYEAACLRCHGASPAPGTPLGTAAKPTVCPVNPRNKCIGCHMPKRKVFPSSRIPIAMADHLIWAYGKKHAPWR